MLPGIHVSSAGGAVQALERAEALSLEAAQIFTSNQTQWKGRLIDRGELEEFRSRRLIPVVSHGSYLINLASDRPEVAAKSQEALEAELERMELLGIRDLVIHPGSHMGRGPQEGSRLIAGGISAALDTVPGKTRILLENTAGMGSSVGCSFDQLAALLDMIGDPRRTGVCIDSAHAFESGYDLGSPDAVDRTIDELDRVIGAGRVGVFHINDSRTGQGSRVDRHAHIGSGAIGLEPLRHLVRHQAFPLVPAIVETPGSDRDRREDLDLLFAES